MSEDEKDEGSGTDVDATGADPEERDAKEELFEAIDHFKNAASILFNRAASDPAVKNVTKEAGRVARQLGDAAEPLAKQVGDAAEPIARQLTDEVGRLTRDVMDLIDGRGSRRKKKRPSRDDDDEE